MVCVVDAERRRGLGTALLVEIVERARRGGLVSVHVDIEASDQPARPARRAATGGHTRTYALAG